MASLGIDGLASGLDTTTIINQLMQIEAAPQTQLKARQSTAQSVSAALTSLNSKVKSLGEAATKAATASNWNTYKATSSSTAATASASTAAASGTLTFSVDSVATRQVSLTATVASGAAFAPDNPPTLTVKKADGSYASVTASSNSLSDIAKAINDGDLGVSATVVQVSGGASPTYRMQFTSKSTGTDGAFELYAADEATVIAGSATRIDASVATTASNASVTLWKGSAYEQTYTQSSNTFSGLMTGVDVTVSAKTSSGETVTVSVAPDDSAVKSLASNLVSQLNLVFSEIKSRTAATTTTNSDGTTSVKGGLLSGDAAVRSVQSQLSQAASYPVDGKSPASFGIVVNRDGTFTFDEAAFASKLNDNPEAAAAFVQSLADRVAGVANAQSHSTSGALTVKIQSQDSLVKGYATQISDWDDRLALRRESLQATYAALEVTLSGLQSQSSWLASQLAALPTIS